LMLLTNDGDLANRILHPSQKVPKTYHVKVSDEPTEKDIDRLRRGIRLEDGMTSPAKVNILKRTDHNTWLEFVLYEGRKRQIRRMVEAIGHRVLRLRRVGIDGLYLEGLRPGELRPLSQEEELRLKRAVQ
jgi:23S rRNA pseudouridine2605 synthase